LYTSGSALVFCLILLGFWRRCQKAEEAGRYGFLTKPGSTFSLMFVLYGLMRFVIEFLRDDNPFEIAHLTISQLLALGVILLGVGFLVFFTRVEPEKLPASRK
jgi:prolipoprotein diacylglyceryltransferase